MKKTLFLSGFFLFVLNMICLPVLCAVELDDVYRMSGKYRICVVEGLRVYFPEACEPVMPRIMATLREVRERITARFPDQSAFEVSVILIDHDDRISGIDEQNFDTIILPLTEEIGALSTRGYSLEERFALRLANVLVMRSLAPAHFAFKRRLGILSMPTWFIEGMTLYNAFPLDAFQISRLLDMAANNRLYSMDELCLIDSCDELMREEMSFQAHALMIFLHKRAGSEAGRRLLKRISQKPGRFDELFREEFGLSLKDAFAQFDSFIRSECSKRRRAGRQIGKIIDESYSGGFYQGLHYCEKTKSRYWVSSIKRKEETYDLWRLASSTAKVDKKPEILLRNVHPCFIVDPSSGTIYIARYYVNELRQRRLTLWRVSSDGKAERFVKEAGSFRPLAIHDNRLWYLNVAEGRTFVKSVSLETASNIRTEFEFPVWLRPLDVALDTRRGELLYIQQDKMQRRLISMSLSAAEASSPRVWNSNGKVLYSVNGIMRYPAVIGDDILFCAETQEKTLQLYRIAAGSTDAVRLTDFQGGVWDYTFNSFDKPIVITFANGGFRPMETDLSEPLIIPSKNENTELLDNRSSFDYETELLASCTEIPKTIPYTSEYRNSFWLPKIGRDDQGTVFGVHSYRSDRLDRDRIELTPTYGFSSNDFGYIGAYQHRFDLFRINFVTQDSVARKSYLSNSYYERDRSQDFSFSYPFSLSTSITAGVNLTHRGIAEYPDHGEAPTVGLDHSIYGKIYHRAIRSEPMWELFPRKGSKVEASWRRGTSMAGGELIYDSFGIRFEKYIPIEDSGWVMTFRSWLAEDDKENDIRRPDDLNLGGSDFLRGYASSVRYGDSLRAVGIHLAHQVSINIPWIQPWVYNEFSVGEIFWEMGDVRNKGRSFQYLYDHGIEFRTRCLIFRRLPLAFRTGIGYPHSNGSTQYYAVIDTSTVSGFME